MKDQRKFKVLSLFSGAMGLDIGLEQTGRFDVIGCVEKVPSFCKTIEANRDQGLLNPDLRIYEQDITSLSPEKVMEDLNLDPGELDLIVGGPPCQSFSTAGNRKTVQDPRGTLLWQFLKYVEVFQPKFFLMENVRGLTSAALSHRPIAKRPPKGPMLKPEEEPGSVLRLFAHDLQTLEDVQYRMDVFEVNSVNYGAPQLRERVLLVGNRFGATVDFPNPTHMNPLESNEASLGQSDLFTNVQTASWATLRDAIGDLKEAKPEVLDFSPRKKSFLSQVPPGGNWRSLPEETQKESMGKAWFAKGGRSGWWRRLTFDLPSPTLVTMPNHSSTALCHPTETRALSVREYARIQEFPDRWIFCGKTSEKYTQIGNAVPVRLGRVAGQVLARQLDDLSSRNWIVPEKTAKPFRIVYIQSHVRTRQWFKNGEAVVWDSGDKEDATYEPMKTVRKISSVIK